MTIEWILLATAGLLVIGVIASKASSRTGIPALLLFLGIGMLAGSEGPGGIAFDNPSTAQATGVVALVLILFSGGLDTSWQVVKPVLWQGLSLANLGVIISAAAMGFVAVFALGFSPLEGLLLGAIVSSTDAAAVFSVMRARSISLKGNLEPLIEFESGSNDPMAVFLTIAITGLLVDPLAQPLLLVPTFVLQMALGAGAGWALGRIMVWALNRIRLGQEGLYPVLMLAMVLLGYGIIALIGGNGFLAVYIAGIVMNNYNFIHKRSLMRFHDGVAWLMQIVMFIILGLLVFPSELIPVVDEGLLMAAALIFFARPLSVFLALSRAKLSINEKWMISWVGLRGAVPIVMATFPLLAGIPRAETIFNIVFFIVLASVMLQGTTIELIARWFKLQDNRTATYHYPYEFTPQLSASSQLIEVTVQPQSITQGRMIMELGLPSGALVVSISRGEEAVVPSGGTVLEAGDKVLVLAEREVLPKVRTAILGEIA